MLVFLYRILVFSLSLLFRLSFVLRVEIHPLSFVIFGFRISKYLWITFSCLCYCDSVMKKEAKMKQKEEERRLKEEEKKKKVHTLLK